MLDVNRPSPGVTKPPGCSKPGSKKWTLELMVIKKGWVEIAVGPPFAPSSYKLPAERSWICAVKSFVSKSTICCCSSGVGSVPSPCACPTVASRDWCARSLSSEVG